MAELDTGDLEKVLGSTHSTDFGKYVEDNKDSMINMSNDFSNDIREHLSDGNLTQKELFMIADIPERYGYKLLSGEKTTRKRDVILRLTIAAGLTLKETQRMLHKYELPELYAKINRDALIMIAINEKKTILETNELLLANGFEALERPGNND